MYRSTDMVKGKNEQTDNWDRQKKNATKTFSYPLKKP